MDQDERENLPEQEGDGAPAGGSGEDAAFLRSDLRAFHRAYPEVDAGALENDAAFLRFCGTRLHQESLAGLYDDYLAVTGDVKRRAETRSGERQRRSTGSGGGAGGGALTAAQQEALREWNRAYPHMKMTTKEFISR